MQDSTIPLFRLTFVTDVPEKNPSNLPPLEKILTPCVSKVSQCILTKLESLATNYVFALRKEFKDDAAARVLFSPREGMSIVSCSDERIKTIYSREYNIQAMSVHYARTHGLLDLKRVEPTPENKTQAEAKLGTSEIIFVDSDALELHQNGVNEAVIVDLQIVRYVLNPKAMDGLTTCALRYPHLLKFLDKNLQLKESMCLVGPGLIQEEDSPPMCPQMVELMTLFPQLRRVVALDNNLQVLTAIEKQFAKTKLAIYDPTMLRHYTRKGESNSYQALFQKIIQKLTECVRLPKNALDILQGTVPAQSLLIPIKAQVEVKEFDIIHSQFDQAEEFDVIIATQSIWRAIANLPKQNHIENLSILGKFLRALKENGSLYMDCYYFNFLKSTLGEEGLSLSIKYLESIVGNALKVENIPISDFYPQACGDYVNLPRYTLKSDEWTTPTSSIIVFTRLSASTPNERIQLEQRLSEINVKSP